MSLIDYVRLTIIRFCLWQADRCVRRSERAGQREMNLLKEAEAWVDCARQHRLEMEGGDAP